MLDAKIIRESFDPKLLSALFKNFSNQYIALFELIDNAVDDRQQDEKLIVSIDYDQEEEKLSIKNFNGNGMSIDDLQKFFTWGHSEKNSGRIGRYGQGGKAALGYLAKSFTIKSHLKKSNLGCCVRIKDWENREVGFTDGFEISMYQSQRDDGDVTFEIYNLKKEFKIDTIRERIRKIYRPLIMQKKVEFIIDNEPPIKCLSINYDRDTYKKFKTEFTLKGIKYALTGEFGIVDDPSSERGGFRIFQYGRSVAEKEYFGHIDPSTRWNVERLYGELYIDFDLPLSMNKTEIDKDSDLWHSIAHTMHKEIKDIMKEAIDYKTPTKKESKAVELINRKINKSKEKKDTKIELTNYGPRLLFKIEESKKGEKTIKINRDHKAYKLWSATELGKKYYTIMIYALTEATKDMSKKESAKFIAEFSEHLGEESAKLILNK
ncbi:MAG: hypothetical protein APR62_03095 [Smithella sp. SDB]|nr:MAG: hypothetical protein APR62_03095 [Smithella sp. SDB]